MAHYFGAAREDSVPHQLNGSQRSFFPDDRTQSSRSHSPSVVVTKTSRRTSVLDPSITRQMDADVLMMLEWSLQESTERWQLHQRTIADLQTERDEALDAFQAKSRECQAMADSLRERVAEETLNVHYAFEERLQSRDQTIDAQSTHIAKLELMLSQSRSHFRDAANQVGEAAVCSPSERDQLQRQLTEQAKHFEELLASERGANERQRQHWEEVLEARLLMERDVGQRNLEVERAKEIAERSRMDASVQRLQHSIQDKDEKIRSLESTIENLRSEKRAEHEDVKRASETFAQVRRSMENKLEDVYAQHSEERAALQVEFERAMKDQNDLSERMLQEERAQRKRVEEEFGMLRADRSRIVAEHREEIKALEAKLIATQVELTKSTERLAEVDSAAMTARNLVSTKERETKEKCARWEEMAIRASEARSEAQNRVTTLEEQLAAVLQERTNTVSVLELEKRMEAALSQHKRDLEGLEQRHLAALEQHRRDAATEQSNQSSRFDMQLRDAQTRSAQFERALTQAFSERDAVQLECASLKRQLRDVVTVADAQNVKTLVNRRAASTQTERQTTRRMYEGGSSDEDDESFTLREQLMKMNNTVWTLQSKLNQSEQDVAFLERTIDELRSAEPKGLAALKDGSGRRASGTISSSAPIEGQHRRAGSEGPSPLRDDERSEAHALFTYFRQ